MRRKQVSLEFEESSEEELSDSEEEEEELSFRIRITPVKVINIIATTLIMGEAIGFCLSVIIKTIVS